MKKILGTILLFVAAVSVCLAEDPAYSDIDAENYIVSRNITDRAEITRVHAWYTGIKALGLYSNITHSVSYRAQHNAVSGSTVVVMNGQNGTITGGLTFTDRGVTYDGSSGNYIAYPNPLSNPVTNYTIVTFCDVPRVSGSYYALFGSYNGSTTKGPSLFIDGSPQAGSAGVGFYYQYYSVDGTVNNGGDSSGTSGLVGGPTWGGAPQMVAAGMSALDYRMVTGLEVVYESLGAGSSSTIWNGNSTWRVGQSLTDTLRLVGNIAYTGVWNEMLTLNKVRALRRLYSKTLGYGYMQNVQLICDGDSLTFGTTGFTPWPTALTMNPLWGNLVSMKNNAVGGVGSAEVRAEIPTQLYPFNVDFDFCKRQYFSTYVGANNIGPLTADEIYDNLKAIWSGGRSAGYIVIAYTLPKIQLQDSAGLSALTRRSIRDALNAKIRGESGRYDILIELDKIPGLQDQSNRTYYDTDDVHYTTAGHALIAAEIMRRIPIP